MAGGITTPELIAAVCNAGALGSLGAGYMEPETLRQTIHAIRELTDRPFAVNLFVPSAKTKIDSQQILRAQQLLDVYRRELDLPTDNLPPSHYLPDYDEQLAVVIEEQVAAASFTFGVPSPEHLTVLRDQDIVTFGTATHLLEAIVLEESGIDFVVAQGMEAGGHRGTFIGDPERVLVGSSALVTILTAQLTTPIIAAGGIMNGAGIGAALAQGAAAVQLGTAFLACPESGAHPAYKDTLKAGTEITTVLTRAFSGKPARALRNRFCDQMDKHRDILPDYPIQNALTRDIRQAAAEQGQAEFMSLWAGQGCMLCSDRSAATLITDWSEELDSIFKTRLKARRAL